MDSSLVKLDNVMAWDGVDAPFCETYSLFIADPQKTWSLCLRFSFDINPEPAPKWGVIEAFFCDAGADPQTLSFRQEYNLDVHDIVHADQFMQIGDCSLSLADCMGTLQDGKNSIKWECVFEDPVLSLRPFPDVFYPFAWPRFKMTYPRFLNFARGQFFINHKKYEFARTRVCQIHGYGKHAAQSVGAHAVGFAEDSDAVLALYAPRFASKTMGRQGLLPHWPCVLFSMEGQTFTFRPWLSFWYRRHLKIRENGFDLTFTRRQYRFQMTLTQNNQHSFALSSKQQLHLLADLHIHVSKKIRGHWQPYKTLTSSYPVFMWR